MSESEKEEKNNESLKLAATNLKADVTWCKENLEYSYFFDDIFESLNKSQSNDKELKAYCARKYVVDKGLIDSTFNVIVNLKNINAEGLDCQQALNETIFATNEILRNKLKGDNLNDKAIECYMKKFSEIKLFEKIIAIEVLTELDLSESQISSERNKFAEAMRQSQSTIRQCIKFIHRL